MLPVETRQRNGQSGRPLKLLKTKLTVQDDHPHDCFVSIRLWRDCALQQRLQQKKLIWQGTTKGRITSDAMKDMEKTLSEAVAEIFAKVPPVTP